MRYYKDERTANEVTRNKAKAATTAFDSGNTRAQALGSEGVIAMDSICAVFNEPGKKGGCSIKLIGANLVYDYSCLCRLLTGTQCSVRAKCRNGKGIQACRTLSQ